MVLTSSKITFKLGNTQKQFIETGSIKTAEYQSYIKSIVISLQGLSGSNPAKQPRVKNTNGKKKTTCLEIFFLVLVVLSFLWLPFLALRILLIYPYIPLPFLVLLFSDIAIGFLPTIAYLIYTVICEHLAKKRKTKVPKNTKRVVVYGLKPKYAQIYNDYLDKAYEDITEVLKSANIIFRWSFKEAQDEGPPIVEFKNGKNIVQERAAWTEGEMEFIENPTSLEVGEMIEKLSEVQREAELRLSPDKRLFSRNNHNENNQNGRLPIIPVSAPQPVPGLFGQTRPIRNSIGGQGDIPEEPKPLPFIGVGVSRKGGMGVQPYNPQFAKVEEKGIQMAKSTNYPSKL